MWLEALAPNANVALVAPPGDVPTGLPPFRFFPAQPSRLRFAHAAAEVLRRGRPVQTLLTAPFVWDRAIDDARRAMGPFAATIVILSRADAWVRSSLDGGIHILDSIDSLRRNAEERGRATWGPMRQFWKYEARRLARTEEEVARAYDHVVIVSEEEIGEFGGVAIAIANSVRITPLDEKAPRQFDIGGADAPRGLRAAAERAGVELQSPIADVATFARGVRVAIAPMRYGSGQSSKLIEAAEAGCAIVTTPHGLRGLPQIARHAGVGSDAASIASAAVALLNDDTRRGAMAKALRREAEEHYSHQRAHRGMAKLAGAVVRE